MLNQIQPIGGCCAQGERSGPLTRRFWSPKLSMVVFYTTDLNYYRLAAPNRDFPFFRPISSALAPFSRARSGAVEVRFSLGLTDEPAKKSPNRPVYRRPNFSRPPVTQQMTGVGLSNHRAYASVSRNDTALRASSVRGGKTRMRSISFRMSQGLA